MRYIVKVRRVASVTVLSVPRQLIEASGWKEGDRVMLELDRERKTITVTREEE